MTGGGDTDELEDDEATLAEADDTAGEDDDVEIDEHDDDPTAGASDIGGRAGEPYDT